MNDAVPPAPKEPGPNNTRNRIRRGKLPRYVFAKDPKNDSRMETELVWKGRWTFEPQPDKTVKRVKALEPKRTWRLVCTKTLLNEKE